MFIIFSNNPMLVEWIRFVQSHGARRIIAEYSTSSETELWDDAAVSSPYPATEEPFFPGRDKLSQKWSLESEPLWR